MVAEANDGWRQQRRGSLRRLSILAQGELSHSKSDDLCLIRVRRSDLLEDVEEGLGVGTGLIEEPLICPVVAHRSDGHQAHDATRRVHRSFDELAEVAQIRPLQERDVGVDDVASERAPIALARVGPGEVAHEPADHAGHRLVAAADDVVRIPPRLNKRGVWTFGRGYRIGVQERRARPYKRRIRGVPVADLVVVERHVDRIDRASIHRVLDDDAVSPLALGLFNQSRVNAVAVVLPLHVEDKGVRERQAGEADVRTRRLRIKRIEETLNRSCLLSHASLCRTELCSRVKLIPTKGVLALSISSHHLVELSRLLRGHRLSSSRDAVQGLPNIEIRVPVVLLTGRGHAELGPSKVVDPDLQHDGRPGLLGIRVCGPRPAGEEVPFSG